VSDFDTVLERLLGDPSFAAALSADPAAALAGYRLTADETALLRSQVTGDHGGQSAVETRANQSSTFGLLTPLAGLAGAAEVFGHVSGVQQGFTAPAATQGFGTPAATQGFGAPGAVQGFGVAEVPGSAQGFGVAEVPGSAQGFGANTAGAAGGIGSAVGAAQGFGAAPAGAAQGFGSAPGGTQGLGAPDATQGFGSADAGSAYAAGFGSADGRPGIGGGLGDEIGNAVNQERGGGAPPPEVPEGYRTRVDVDGDGTWDRHSLRGTRGGGVDIMVDANSDGRVDFIGHDRDADGLVDSAEYDKNHDGFFERRSYDDNGDGWLDRHETRRPPVPPPVEEGGMIGRNLPLPDER
jgi:hypothetical protein